MSGLERVMGVVKDVVLPVDVRTRYDVYFTDRRVAIVCMGKATRFESDTEEPLSLMASAFGVPAPMAPYSEKRESPSIDDEAKGLSLDDLLKLSKKSCFYTLQEIEEVKLVWGSKPKFLILSKDCESKFTPDGSQINELIEIIPAVEGLKDKLWISGKYSELYGEGPVSPVCKSCGSNNDSDAAYCQTCGKKLEEETANLPSSELICSQCGTKNSAQASFCKQCGTPIH